MLLDYYGLIDQPFGVTPDPRFLYLGAKHREALASLNYGTESNRGFIALIAEPGMGKTSLLFQYLEGLRGKARTAFVFQTDCHRRELLRHILSDLGLDATGKDLPAMHEMFNRLLLEEMQAGRRFVLVIDEAQNLEEKVLESVRLLSNFETPWMKLMHIVIAGQPQLAERLAKPSLAQLRQRIAIIARIEPFTCEETAEYIYHRLRVAGYKGQSPFTADARLMIAEHSHGIPRNINNICFNAMSLACALKRKNIGREVVAEVLADLDLGSLNKEAIAQPTPDEKRTHHPAEAPRKEKPKSIFGICAPRLIAVTALSLLLSGPVEDPNKGSQMQIPLTVPTGEQDPPASPSEQRSLVLIKHEETQSNIQAGKSEGLRSVKILPGQTLYHVVVKNVGIFNDEIFRELCELNPWLVDPSKVRSGQTIVLPLARKLSATKLFIANESADPEAASVEKQ